MHYILKEVNVNIHQLFCLFLKFFFLLCKMQIWKCVISIYINLCIRNPPSQVGCDTTSTFYRSLMDFNSEIPFSEMNHYKKVKEPILLFNLPIAGEWLLGGIPFVICPIKKCNHRRPVFEIFSQCPFNPMAISTHTHTHTYIYIYIYVCVCVCACSKLWMLTFHPYASIQILAVTTNMYIYIYI